MGVKKYLGRLGGALDSAYEVQVFDLEQDLNFEKGLREQFAQMEAAGEMKAQQQAIRNQQVTGGVQNTAWNATFFNSMTQFFAAILKWMLFFSVIAVGIGLGVKSTLAMNIGVFLFVFSAVYLFYIQGPMSGSYQGSFTPIGIALVVAGIITVITWIFGKKIIEAIHGPQ